MTQSVSVIELNGNDLTFAQLYSSRWQNAKVSLASVAAERMNASRAVVDRLVASGKTAYGIKHRLRQTCQRAHFH